MVLAEKEVSFSWTDKSMLINIATPGWNEYEEVVNCFPQNEAEPKGEEQIQRRCVITVITALVPSLLFPLRSLSKTYHKFAVTLDRYIST